VCLSESGVWGEPLKGEGSGVSEEQKKVLPLRNRSLSEQVACHPAVCQGVRKIGPRALRSVRSNRQTSSSALCRESSSRNPSTPARERVANQEALH
jgi:hypothetical protein